MRLYLKLTKSGIVAFVLLTGLAGYGLSLDLSRAAFSGWHFIAFLLGLYLISSGSCALNQVQEVETDRRMPRTASRPLALGLIPWGWAFGLAAGSVFTGAALLYVVSPLSCALGMFTVVLYNILYTVYWKPKWTFAAIPGAIPGALPVVIGYSANSQQIFSAECIYVFLVMFLWQMPHFWALAIRFRDDYAKAGIPVLPAQRGVPETLYHIGVYVFMYVALVIASPWFVEVYYVYLAAVIPLALKVLFEFFRFYRGEGEKRWLPFFMWTNISVLVFVVAPVLDKWHLMLLVRAG